MLENVSDVVCEWVCESQMSLLNGIRLWKLMMPNKVGMPLCLSGLIDLISFIY